MLVTMMQQSLLALGLIFFLANGSTLLRQLLPVLSLPELPGITSVMGSMLSDSAMVRSEDALPGRWSHSTCTLGANKIIRVLFDVGLLEMRGRGGIYGEFAYK